MKQTRELIRAFTPFKTDPVCNRRVLHIRIPLAKQPRQHQTILLHMDDLPVDMVKAAYAKVALIVDKNLRDTNSMDPGHFFLALHCTRYYRFAKKVPTQVTLLFSLLMRN